MKASIHKPEFSLDRNFAKPSHLCIVEKKLRKNFHQCGKGHHILYAVFNTGQKIRMIKILANESRWRNWQKFLRIWYVHVHTSIFAVPVERVGRGHG